MNATKLCSVVTIKPILRFFFTGQFFRKGVDIDETRKILIMPDKEPVPVMRRPVWSFMERDS